MSPAVLFFLLFLLSGCTMAGDFLSGSLTQSGPVAIYPSQLSQVRIGATTKEDVRNLFGNPSDLQVSSHHETTRESWAYANASPSIHPLQYVPVFGVLAFPAQQERSSFSISFSSEGIVEGIALREVQPYGEIGATSLTQESTLVIQPYGGNNPLTHLTRHDASVGSGVSRR